MRYVVYPYKQGSRSAKMLAETLDGKVLKREQSKFRPRVGDVVVNWGASAVPQFAPATTLNVDVSLAQCKLKTFKALSAAGVRVPEWTEDKAVASGWLDAKTLVVCRTILNGHSGAGIVMAYNQDELVKAPLYTRYVKKQDEYRVHVMGDEVFFVQRKAKKHDAENPNWQVRNLAGGFVFVEVPRGGDEAIPLDVINQAKATIKALNLDFGGVDVIWNQNEGKAYVLEVNTACGLEDRTADNYCAALHRRGEAQ